MTNAVNPPAGSPEDMQPSQDVSVDRHSDSSEVRIWRIRSVVIESLYAMTIALVALALGRINQDWFGAIVLSCIGSPLIHLLAGMKMRGIGVQAAGFALAAASAVRHLSITVLALALLGVGGCAGGMPSPVDARNAANDFGTLLDEGGSYVAAVCEAPHVRDTPKVNAACDVLSSYYDRIVALYNKVNP